MKYISLSLQTLESKNDHVVERRNFDILKIFPTTPLYHKVHKLCAKIHVLHTHELFKRSLLSKGCTLSV